MKYVHPSIDQPHTLHPVVILGDKTTYFQLCCVGVKDRSINGQCLICFMTSLVIGAPVNILCFLVFILSFICLSRKKIKKSSQILGREVKLFWGFIFLLNVYVLHSRLKSYALIDSPLALNIEAKLLALLVFIGQTFWLLIKSHYWFARP